MGSHALQQLNIINRNKSQANVRLVVAKIYKEGFLCYMVREHCSHREREYVIPTNKMIRRIET